MSQPEQNRKSILNTVLIVMVGQVGCLTLGIILVSVFGGRWLDDTFGTKPLFTLILLIAGVPLSVLLMLFVARRTIAKIKSDIETENSKNQSEK
jgi:F0F1-type ATP synthase assembly protein I